MAKLEELVVELSADTRKLRTELINANKVTSEALNKMTKSTEKFSKKGSDSAKFYQDAMSSLAGFVGSQAVIGAFRKLWSSMGDGVQTARDFNKAVTEINTILPKNTKLTKEQTESLKQYSASFASSSSSQAKAYYQIISAGITDTSKALEVLEHSNKLAIGGLGDLGSVVDVVTDIVNVYGDEVGSVEDITNSLFKTVQLGKTTIPELSAGLGGVINIARTMGVSLDGVNASLATMTSQGEGTAKRVTQLRSLFNSFARNSKEISKYTDLSTISTRGLGAVLNDLAVATKGSNTKLFELLGTSESVQGFLSLTGKSAATLADNMEKMNNKADASAKAFKEVAESSDFKLKKASEQIELFKQSIGDSLLPMLGDLAEQFNKTNSLSFLGGKQNKSVEDYKNQIELLTEKQEELNRSTLEGSSLFSGNSQMMAMNRAELYNTTAALKEAKHELAELNNQNFISSSSAEQLIAAERNLATMREELEKSKDPINAFSNALSGIAVKSDVQLLGDIDAQIKKVEELKNAVAGVKVEKSDGDSALEAELAGIQKIQEEKKKLADINAEYAKGLANQSQSIDNEYNMQLESLQMKHENEAISHEEYFNQLNTMQEAQHLKEQDALKNALDNQLITREEFNQAKSELDQQQLMDEARFLDAKNKQRAASDKQTLDDRRSTYNTIASMQNSSNKTLASAGKAFAIYNATVDGYAAVQKALGAFPPPFNFAMAALVGAATASNVSKIAGTNLAGGIDSVPGVGNRDNFPANLMPGERVVPTESNKDLTEFLRNQGNGGSKTITINISNNLPASREAGESMIEAINDALAGGSLRILEA